jgi:hypothetical protein
MRKFIISLIFMFFCSSVSASSFQCKNRSEIQTAKGALAEDICTSSDSTEDAKSIWRLGNRELVEGKYPISKQDRNEAKTVFLLQAATNSRIGCPDRMYLVDLAGTSPKVFAFGIKNACNVYHWAKWSGKKRSVIALKYNVQFTYLNGKLIPPEDTDGDKFGTPLGYAAPTPSTPLAPFVQELPLPHEK